MVDKTRCRVLVIGAGSIGARHVRCLLATGRAEVGVCEPVDAVRERVAADHPLCEVYSDIETALAAGWDSAVIATPAHTHIAIAQRVIGAGVAPLIEKPLAVVDDGVAELICEASARGLVAGVAYVYRAHPALRAMRQAIASGRFGRPLQLIAVAGQHFPTYRPGYASTYYASHTQGGGAIQDALTHVFNAAEWLVGPITRLTVDAAHLKLAEVDVEDTVHVLARHGEVMASYAMNQHQAPNEMVVTVVCERGTARFELHRHRWRWMTEPDTPWQEEVAALADRDAWFTQQEHAWLDAIEGTAAPLCSLEEGLQTLRVNVAALASAADQGAWKPIAQETTA